MEDFTGFKTPDGTLFEDREEAALHERQLILRDKLRDLCERNGIYKGEEHEIADALFNCRETLSEMFFEFQDKEF